MQTRPEDEVDVASPTGGMRVFGFEEGSNAST